MTLDHRLINLLVCPVCKGALEMRRLPDERGELRPTDLLCNADQFLGPVDQRRVAVRCRGRVDNAAENRSISRNHAAADANRRAVRIELPKESRYVATGA